MKFPTPYFCPICLRSMLRTEKLNGIIHKWCYLSPNHNLNILTLIQDELWVYELTLTLCKNKTISYVWDFDGDIFWAGTQRLPIFIPNFFDLTKLINKIKTYQTFK